MKDKLNKIDVIVDNMPTKYTDSQAELDIGNSLLRIKTLISELKAEMESGEFVEKLAEAMWNAHPQKPVTWSELRALATSPKQFMIADRDIKDTLIQARAAINTIKEKL